mgnify:CR=1 FL=1
MSDHRHAKIKVSGAPSLQLRSLRGRESLGRIFEFEVDLWGTDPNLKHEDLVGKAATVLMQLPVFGGVKRHFTGVISRFEQSGFDGSFAFYRASLVPWTWLLTRWSTCRILAMNTKASEHIQQILNDHASGMGAVTPRLNFSGYRSWEYCVQYNETTFNFISRLLEQEGIYYFFKHNADGTHDIVLCDGPSSHNEFDLGNIEFRHPGDGDDLKAYIRSWNIETRLQPEFYRVRDWDFLHPQQPVTGTASAENPVVPGDAEIYEYPGEFVAEGEGNQYANVRLQALTAQRSVIRGTTDHPAMAAGMKFTFKPDRHMYRNDQGKAYLVTSASYEIHVAPRVGGEPGSDGPPWACNFTAMDASVQFRTPRTTPKPIVQGPQTAIVTGKSDSEIDADEHGRVTVKFPWDLDPKYDDTSSIRVRVSQAWAGKGWGYLFTPRVGQEVVVEFLEGDPDRPLITGRVYNDENKPPYDPKQFPTISVIKSSSSKGGEGFNELRFEDKKDSEMIWMHAQKRMDIRVRGNYRETNYGNRDVRVGWESSDDSGGSYNILVKEDVNEWIKKGVYEKVDTVHNRTVVEDVVEDFQKNQTTFVKETYQLNAKKIIVEGADLVSHKSKKVLIEGSTQGVSIKSGADMKLTANGVLSLKGGQKIAGEGQMGVSFKGLQLVVEAQTGINVKVGGSFLSITPAGIDIMGPLVKINEGGSALSSEAPAMAETAADITPPTMEEPLEAAVADDGKPGKVSKPGSGKAPGRKSKTLDPQDAPESPPFPPPPPPPPDVKPPEVIPPPPPVTQPDSLKDCGIDDLIVACSHSARKAGAHAVLQIVPSTTVTSKIEVKYGIATATLEHKSSGQDKVTGEVKVVDEAKAARKQLCVRSDGGSPSESDWKTGGKQTFPIEAPPYDGEWPKNEPPKKHIIFGRGCDDVTQSITVECFPSDQHSIEVKAEAFAGWAKKVNEGWEKWGKTLMKIPAVKIKPKITPPTGSLKATWGWKEDSDWQTYFELSADAGLTPIFGIGIDLDVSIGTLVLAGLGVPPFLGELLTDHLADIIFSVGAEAKAELTGGPRARWYSSGATKIVGEITFKAEGTLKASLTGKVGSDYIASARLTLGGKTTITGSATSDIDSTGLYIQPKVILKPLSVEVKVVFKAFYFYEKEKVLGTWTPWEDVTLYEGPKRKLLPRDTSGT